MLYRGTICRLTEKTQFLYRYLLQNVPQIKYRIISVHFGVKALKDTLGVPKYADIYELKSRNLEFPS